MITYDKLWETMKKKDVSQYKLIKDYGISAGQLSRLRANVHISTHTIDMLCSILKCNVEDILTYYPDEDQSNVIPQTVISETRK